MKITNFAVFVVAGLMSAGNSLAADKSVAAPPIESLEFQRDFLSNLKGVSPPPSISSSPSDATDRFLNGNSARFCRMSPKLAGQYWLAENATLPPGAADRARQDLRKDCNMRVFVSKARDNNTIYNVVYNGPGGGSKKNFVLKEGESELRLLVLDRKYDAKRLIEAARQAIR